MSVPGREPSARARARRGRPRRRARDDQPTRRPGRPAGASGDRTRERIVRAAVEIFARDGLAGASVRDIARQARIRVSTLYHYFPAKEALYREVQDRVHAEIREQMLSVLGSGLDIRETAREAVGRAFEFFLGNRAYAKLGYRTALEVGPAIEAGHRIADRWVGFIEGALRPAEVRGLVKEIDPVFLMATVDALLHWHIVNEAFYRRLLGRGLDDADVARRAREHVISVALRTLGLE